MNCVLNESQNIVLIKRQFTVGFCVYEILGKLTQAIGKGLLGTPLILWVLSTVQSYRKNLRW